MRPVFCNEEVNSDGADQTAHPRSLVWAIIVRVYKKYINPSRALNFVNEAVNNNTWGHDQKCTVVGIIDMDRCSSETTMLWELTLFSSTHRVLLTFITLWASSAGDKMIIVFLTFRENRLWRFMQIVSSWGSLHEMSKPIFREKTRKYLTMSSAENFTQNAKR